MTTVELQDLTIGYSQRSSAKAVQTGINAKLCKGQFTCLIGHNGTGKSTLLRTLAAFQPQLSGRIVMHTVNGVKELSALSKRELSLLIAVVLTERTVVSNMTVEQFVAMGRAPHTGFWGALSRHDRDVVREAMATVGIEQIAERMVDTLSDGQRQKTVIAKALAQETPLLYLDEPTAFLDFPSKVEIMLLLKRICRQTEKSVLLSTHDLEIALQTADSLWVMDRGGTPLTVGTPRQLADDGTLTRFFQNINVSFDPATLELKASNI